MIITRLVNLGVSIKLMLGIWSAVTLPPFKRLNGWARLTRPAALSPGVARPTVGRLLE
jgi:hypothetical protein